MKTLFPLSVLWFASCAVHPRGWWRHYILSYSNIGVRLHRWIIYLIHPAHTRTQYDIIAVWSNKLWLIVKLINLLQFFFCATTHFYSAHIRVTKYYNMYDIIYKRIDAYIHGQIAGITQDTWWFTIDSARWLW